jgi:hypothetical protein
VDGGALMPVALLPPVSSSGAAWRGQMPLLAAPRYVRGPSNSRWHRNRSGMQWPTGRITIHFWCGPSGHTSPQRDVLHFVDNIPAGEPACGTCVGRALGAGQDEVPADLPPLRFDPRWLAPPRFCPGSRSRELWQPVGSAAHSVGQCLVCGELVAIRAIGRGYNAWGAGPVHHTPGGGLVEPCPFHAWQRIVARDGRAVCDCGWPPEPSPTDHATHAGSA